MPSRREVIARSVTFALAMALGKLDTLQAQDGHLVVPLDQWKGIVFRRKNKQITISVDEVFQALVDMPLKD